MFDRGFYRCDCGWDGNELIYAGSNNNNELLEILASQRSVLRFLHLRHAKGQGCCPNCGKAFAGCVDTDIWGKPEPTHDPYYGPVVARCTKCDGEIQQEETHWEVPPKSKLMYCDECFNTLPESVEVDRIMAAYMTERNA